MTHFPDGSPYTYLPRELPVDGEVVNIGWLDGSQPFPTGPVPPQLVERLAELCQDRVNCTRGFHTCDLCAIADRPPFSSPTRSSVATGSLPLGSAEIRVVGSDSTVYAAPDMVLHYVEQHSYRPPEAFIEAVVRRDPGAGDLR